MVVDVVPAHGALVPARTQTKLSAEPRNPL